MIQRITKDVEFCVPNPKILKNY